MQARLEQKAISCPQVCLLSKENYAKRISRRALCRRIIEATSLRVILTVSQKGQNMPDTLLEATVIITTTGLCLSSLLSPRPHLQFPLGINLLFTLFQMLCCCDHNAGITMQYIKCFGSKTAYINHTYSLPNLQLHQRIRLLG